MQKTLTVKGKGTVTKQPDWITIQLELTAKQWDYAQTVATAGEQLESVRQCLKVLGFVKEDIKTSRFNIDTSYKSLKDRHGNHQTVFDGYKLSHALYFGFSVDHDRMGQILSALSVCEAKPTFSIHYEIQDQEELKNELLNKAVQNALDKANVIAQAASVTIGDIARIDYDWSEIRIRREPLYQLREDVYAETSMLDIQPDDIEASDNVTVVFNLA